MYKNRRSRWMLVILVLVMVIFSYKVILVNNKFINIKNQVFSTTNVKNTNNVEKYGYSDIIECLGKNKNFVFKSMSMLEDGICNVEVNYKGDIKLLYSYLCSLNESKNFLGIKSINTNKDSKITIIKINFLKNK